MNTNSLALEIYIYDKQNAYVMYGRKQSFLDRNIFLDKKVLSFEFYCDDLYIQLDF